MQQKEARAGAPAWAGKQSYYRVGCDMEEHTRAAVGRFASHQEAPRDRSLSSRQLPARGVRQARSGVGGCR